MTLTTLDATAALVLIDLQRGVLGIPGLPDVDGVVSRAAALAAAFRSHGLPVVLVNVAGGPSGRTEQQRPGGTLPEGWTELAAELRQQPDDVTVTKTSPGAFATTELDAILRERGVTQVVLAGVATGTGVESTARAAYDLGYNLTFAIDAMADRSPEIHEHSVTRIFPRLGETGDTDEIIALVDATRE